MNKKLVYQIIHSLFLGCLAALFVLYFIWNKGSTNSPVQYFAVIAMIVGIIFSSLYFYLDYKKEAYLFYKGFMWSITASFGLFLVSNLNFSGQVSLLVTIPNLIVFGISIPLALGKNMGKKTTLVLCIIVALCVLTHLIYHICISNSLAEYAKAAICLDVVKIVFVISSIVMVLGKYNDKKERGRNC